MYADRQIREIDTEDLSQVIIDWTTELRHDRQLILEQSYVIYNQPNTTIRLQFSTQAILEMCQARALLVDVVDGLLGRINSSPVSTEVVPSPLTSDQLEVYIDFQTYEGWYIDPYYIGWVVLEKGIAYYYAFNLKDKRTDCWEARHEPYFKSRSFVNLERDAEELYKKSHPKKASVLGDDLYRIDQRAH